MSLLDDDELEEYAELWGVEPEDVEALAEAIDLESEYMTDSELNDYLESLADEFDLDISDLYDMYYGYTPGGEA